MKKVAVLGASTDRGKFGNKAVRAFLNQGYRVFPVNPRGGEIEGLPVSTSIGELLEKPDIVSVYLPPHVLLGQLDAIAASDCDELWINPGAGSPEVTKRAGALGLQVVSACSILKIGESPSDY